MKGIFITALVFAIAASAGAGLFFTVNGTEVPNNEIFVFGCQSMMIGIGNTQGADQYNAALILSGMGEWTGQSRLNRPLPLADGWVRYGYQPDFGGDIWYAFFAQPVTDKLSAGIIGEVAYTCTGVGKTTIVLADGDLNPLQTLMINQPEPATLALLGFGLAMLRRRVNS